MDRTLIIFGTSFLVSLAAWGALTTRYFWPWLRSQPREAALRPILAVHSFRFLGLAFLVPGVVAPGLPAAFAVPAAYGDLIAALLALLTIVTLRTPAGIPLAWLFSLWGTGDLLYAFYQGLIGAGAQPGQLGAAYFIPTAIVPLLYITHGLGFAILLRPAGSGASPR
jgi:hypothetical protein